MADSPSIDAYTKLNDWDSAFRASPSCEVGEFSRNGSNPVVADLNALTFTEKRRTPVDGDTSRSQGKFRKSA